DLFNPPALANFLGCAQTALDVTAVRNVSFPPFGQAREASALCFLTANTKWRVETQFISYGGRTGSNGGANRAGYGFEVRRLFRNGETLWRCGCASRMPESRA